MFFYFSTKHACDRRTDKQTDKQNYDPKTALAYKIYKVGKFWNFVGYPIAEKLSASGGLAP